MFKPIVVAMLVVAPLCSQGVKHTPEQAKALVARAIQYGKQYGVEKLISEATAGAFHVGAGSDLYISIYDAEGTIKAIGFNPKGLVGNNGMALKDADGKMFFKEIMTQAKAKGSGWVDYKWKNPTTNEIAAKSTYFEAWNGYVIASGIYK